MSHITTTGGMQWHYKEEGAGPPLVFLHGWGVSKDIWRQQAAYFKKFYRVLVLDLPGHGDAPWQEASLDTIAGDIKAALSALGMEEGVHFVGSSLGGLIGLQLYKDYPGIFRSITFVGSLPKFTKSGDFSFGFEPLLAKKLRGQILREYPSIVNIFFRSLFTPLEREDVKFEWARSFSRNQKIPQQQALLSFLDLLEKTDLRSVLPALKVPVLCINGTDDMIVPVGYLKYIKSQIPHSQCYRVAGAGHFPFVIHAEVFNRILADFLTRQVKEAQ